MTTEFPVSLPGAPQVSMWAHPEDVEPAAQQQLRNIAALPWTHRVSVMPDVHLGKGATVGSVIAMKQAVAPSAVGVDIGCGMTAVQTSLTSSDLPDDLRSLRMGIEQVVPLGPHAHEGTPALSAKDRQVRAAAQRLFDGFASLRAPRIADREFRAVHQCGTLGGGNHFIEVTVDDNDQVWVMLHSGSRNIGKEIAERHIATARTLEHNLGLPDRDLAVFLAGSEEMSAYLHDVYWAQEYARINRAVMMELVQQAVVQVLPQVTFGQVVSCHHNYISEETYDDVDVIVTRKGAIRAGRGDLGLIPGSMGTGSYVVRGMGNTSAMNSASHGAGRRMSRSAARRTFTVEDLVSQTAGVECRKDAGVLDEIPSSYKDLEAVIEAQTSGEQPLVEVVTRLRTVLCVKG
nr:RtcB family protein [Austwickia sp. TVS 96-490-7B]